LWPNTFHDGYQPLEPILNQHPKYHTFRKQLRKHNILYLEQLCTADNSTLLKWHHLSPRLHNLTKGRQPLWFTYLEDTILSDRLHRLILPHFQPPGVNAFAYNTSPIKKKLKPWLLTYNNDNEEIIIGKIRKYLPNTNQFSISHWNTNIDFEHKHYYPLPDLNCTPCTGCHLNSNRVKQTCTINISATICTSFLGRKTPKFKFNANYLDLIYSTAIKHSL